MKVFMLIIASLFTSTLTQAAAPWQVEDFVAVYRAKVGIARGQTKLALRRQEGNRFVVESWTELTGVIGFFKRGEIYEYCEFDYVDGDVLARVFERRDDINREDRNVRVTYDWPRGQANVAYQDRETLVDIEPGVTNTLLMQVALMQELSSGNRVPTFDVVGHKGRLRFEVSYEGNDELSINGQRRALYRYSHSRVDSGIRTTFWAEPERAHLPLVARIEKNRKLKGELNLVETTAGPSSSAD